MSWEEICETSERFSKRIRDCILKMFLKSVFGVITATKRAEYLQRSYKFHSEKAEWRQT